MSEKINDGGAAFPASDCGHGGPYGGMTLRDWFAGQALANLVRDYETTGQMISAETVNEIAGDAYAMADAMLATRSSNMRAEA